MHGCRTLPTVPLWLFWILISALYSVVVIIEFHDAQIADVYGFFKIALQFAANLFFASAFILLLCSWRCLFAVFFPVLAVISAVISFYNITINTRLTSTALEVALVNDASMWSTVISPSLLVAIAIALAISIAAAIYRWRFVRSSRRCSCIACAIALAVSLLPPILPSVFYGTLGMRLPYSIFFAIKEFSTNRSRVAEHRDTYAGVEAVAPHDAPDVIFVIGESLRADHVPFNGYSRNTMPRLSTLPGVVSLPNITTVHTITHTSVPHILTRRDTTIANAAYEQQSFITLFSTAGYRSVWLANQSLATSYSYFAHEADTLIFTDNASRSTFTYTLWLDADLLAPLSSWLRDGRQSPRLAILHTIGSHWWYCNHYGREHALFTPEARHNDVGRLPLQEIINSYDNSIVATDALLADIYGLMRHRNAIIFYISDHGEALGEDGAFLHAGNGQALHRPACLVLYTPRYAEIFPDKVAALRVNRNLAADNEIVFHTLLDLAGIRTSALDTTLSLLRR